MPNPWLKKNPFMSMWLSAANRIAASMRGQAAAHAKRQINAAWTQATNDNLKRLFEAAVPTLPKAKTKTKRRR
jgi:serine/threonine-protein kinase RIO1